MSSKHTPIVQCDFIDAFGDRVFSLCLLDTTSRKAVAFINYNKGSFEKVGLTEPFRYKVEALKRLARIYMKRSIPQNLR